MQLEFLPYSKEEKLERKCQLLEEKVDKMRKSQYQLINEVKRISLKNKEDMEILKSAICKRESHIQPWLFN